MEENKLPLIKFSDKLDNFKFIPLVYYFNKTEENKTEENEIDVWDLLEKHEDYNDTLDKFGMIDNLNYGELIELKEKFKILQTYHVKNVSLKSKVYFEYIPEKIVFDEEIKKINDRLILEKNPAYNIKIRFEEDELNGYKLPLYHQSFNISIDTFLEISQLWVNEPEMSYDEFCKEFEKNACTEWYKMDKHGEYFTGYWNYPEGSYERNNAMDLTFKDNRKALFDLPYPKKFILYTVEFGCDRLLESVPFSNFMCEWVKRKLSIMNRPTLEQICIKKLYDNKNTEDIPEIIKNQYKI